MDDTLISSSLLLDGGEDHMIKLHDLIRDVARSIAVMDPRYAFSLVRCGSQLPDNPEYSTRKLLDLHLEKNDIRFPDGPVCPQLHNLWLHCNRNLQQLSGGFFSIFVNLRFLLIEETLCFWDCLLPQPLDLPNLKYLRKLEVEGVESRVLILPNSICTLPNLEEFHIPKGFEIQDDGSGQSSDALLAPIVTEIGRLVGLKSLRMSFRNSEPFRDINIFDNLLEYSIWVSRTTSRFINLLKTSVSVKRFIYVEDSRLEGLESLIERAEKITLMDTDVNVSSIWNNNRNAFSDLSEMFLNTCNTMQYLAGISQDQIHNACQPLTYFSNLTDLKIECCSSLRYLFSKSVAKGLVQLQKLKISSCHEFEAIIMNEETDNGDILNFPN